MGKKQHSKDRMFITKTEWATEWGGAKSKEIRTPFKRLPFYCCSYVFFLLYFECLTIVFFFFLLFLMNFVLLCPFFFFCSVTFTPFEDAVCTEDGSVFDVM